MKSIGEFLNELESLNIKIWADGDTLHCKAPSGVLNQDIREEISRRKNDILTFLRIAASSSVSDEKPIPCVHRTGNMPLSFAQERLWFLNQFDSQNSAYNVSGAVHIAGNLSITTTEKVLNEIIRRHEILRTSFADIEGRPIQVIAPELKLELQIKDLRHMPKSQQNHISHELCRLESQTLFDLSKLPLIRAMVQQLAENEHILCVTMHHIISDACSIDIFIREFAVLHSFPRWSVGTRINGQLSGQKATPQYADFACWQRERLTGRIFEEKIGWWKKQLDGIPSILELPADRPRPRIQTFNGNTLSFIINSQMTEKLERLGRINNATLFMTLYAAFALLICRYTDYEDIVIGTPVSGRNHKDIEQLIGLFVNTIVLRTDLSGNPTFTELLKRVRHTALEAYSYQDVPFEKIVDSLQLERNLSHHPLFQIMFVFQNAPDLTIHPTGLKFTIMEISHKNAKFDLTLFMEKQDNRIKSSIEYNTDLFDDSRILRMIGHFQILLKGITTNPNLRIRDLPILTDSEISMQCAVGDMRHENSAYCLHQLFEKQVEQTPDATAVIENYRFPTPLPPKGGNEGGEFTYRELNARANQLAHYLKSLGVRPEIPVGILTERSIEMIIGIFGILKAGGAYVPLDPDYPKDRLDFMIQDAGISIIVTQKHLISHFSRIPHRICLDKDWQIIAQESTENPASIIDSENAAYIIYTSGSTGRPKGTVIAHRGVVNYLTWCIKAYQVAEGNGAPVHSPLAFDATITALFSPLLTGKPVFLVPKGDELSALAQMLTEKKRFSLIKITPAHLDALRYLIPNNDFKDTAAFFVIGGEALHAEQLAFWREKNIRLINEYGPTETVVGCCTYEISNESPTSGSIPIGKPIDNTTLFILDRYMNTMPVGIPGELYIGGAGVATGYISRPDLTAQQFVPDPFSGISGARLYKTGDLAQYLPDGNIEFLGRIDNQVKIRGFRIELGEIEAVIAEHSAVQQCVVNFNSVRNMLAAYVVLKEMMNDECRMMKKNIHHSSFIIHHLKSKLPDYMIPSAFVFLDAMPLTSNGKIDRQKLPDPDFSDIRADNDAPRNPAEEIMASIWAEVLNVATICIHDNFFTCGGHSLLAVQIISRLRKIFQVELPVRCVFEYPTIAALSRYVESIRYQKPGKIRPPIRPIKRDQTIELSFAQERLWFLNQLQGPNAAYNIFGAIHIAGNFDIPKTELVVNEIIRRHEVLRTTFADIRGKPVQVINPDMNISLTLIDLQHIPENQRKNEALKIASQKAQTPFNLSKAPLISFSVIKLAEDEHIFCVVMHHIISDGWSIGIFVREFAALYNSGQKDSGQWSVVSDQKESCQLSVVSCQKSTDHYPLTTDHCSQYADFAHWQREWMTGAVLEEHLNYWKKQLAGIPAMLELPTDRQRPRVQTFNGNTLQFVVSSQTTNALKQIAEKSGVTLFMTMYAAFATLLFRYTGQKDIVIGVPVANRNDKDIENLIGLFVNTLVLRADMTGNPAFTELLDRIRLMTLDAYAYQDMPFEKLVDAIKPERNLSRHPLFQVMFVFGMMNDECKMMNDENNNLSFTMIDIENKTAKFDLTLFMEEIAEGIKGAFEYNTDLFDEFSISRMIENFQALLEEIIANPDERVGNKRYARREAGRSHRAEEDSGKKSVEIPTNPNPIEEKIASVWAEVLSGNAESRINHLSFTIHHSFFDLGGHSLLAAQVISRLNEEFQIRLSVRHIFDYPTISELSAYIATILRRSDMFQKIQESDGEEGEI